MSCRQGEDFRGPWGAPSMMALEGGSFGFQIGGQATDFVLLVMNESGARGILASKVKLGADASVAAGPVGRDASADTDATLRAEILSYSRARGLFAGVSLEANDPSRQWRQPPSVWREGFREGHRSVQNCRRAPSGRAIDLDPGCEDPQAQVVGDDVVDAVRPRLPQQVVHVAEPTLFGWSIVRTDYFRCSSYLNIRRNGNVTKQECDFKNSQAHLG